MKLISLIFSMLFLSFNGVTKDIAIVEEIEEKIVIIEYQNELHNISKELFPLQVEVGDAVKRIGWFYAIVKDETIKRKIEIKQLEEEVWN